MVKKIKLLSRNVPNIKISNIFYILLLTILCILIIYGIYLAIKKVSYIYRLKHNFYKLRDMGFDVTNYNIIYLEEIKKKHIMNVKRLIEKTDKNNIKFKNKNTIGFITDKYIVLDFDTKLGIESADFLLEKIPKDTVSEKTPNGYHYYFENDTGNTVHTYIQLIIDDVKYSVDILGKGSIVNMSPSCINGKDYYWINSIFTHTPAKLSENMWLLDLIKNNKPFNRRFDNVDITLNLKGAFVIVDNLKIESQFRFIYGNLKEYSKKIKLFNGVIYFYDDNYYFFTKSSFKTIKNKKYLINKLKNIVTELNPSYIIDLSIIYSNYLKPNSIIQLTSAVIHNDFKNYKNADFFENYIQLENGNGNGNGNGNIYKTNFFNPDIITINNINNKDVIQSITRVVGSHIVKTNKILVGSESIYISIFLSNYFNIPNLCLGIVSDMDTDTDPTLSSKPEIVSSDKITNTFFSLF